MDTDELETALKERGVFLALRIRVYPWFIQAGSDVEKVIGSGFRVF